jgi:hypothetical protein
MTDKPKAHLRNLDEFPTLARPTTSWPRPATTPARWMKRPGCWSSWPWPLAIGHEGAVHAHTRRALERGL